MKKSPKVIFLAIVVAGGSILLGPVYLMIGLWKQYPLFNPFYIPLIGMILAILILLFGPNEKE